LFTKLDDSITGYSLVISESCHGTTATWENDQTIIDSSNKAWKVHANGFTVNNDWRIGDASLLLYWNQTVYRQNYDDPPKWWKWINSTWVSTNDPRPSLNSTVTPRYTLPPSTGRYESLSHKRILYTVNH